MSQITTSIVYAGAFLIYFAGVFFFTPAYFISKGLPCTNFNVAMCFLWPIYFPCLVVRHAARELIHSVVPNIREQVAYLLRF